MTSAITVLPASPRRGRRGNRPGFTAPTPAMPSKLRLVAYLRVSTVDHDQDPERQGDVLRAWAERSGHEIVAWVTDEGTSGGIEALQRQKVREAIEQAKELGCQGLVVEAHDRWTRAGPEDFWVSKFFMRLDHDLRLLVANVPPGMPEEMVEAWDSMQAAMAKAFRKRLVEQVTSGLARAKRLGWPKGKPGMPPKPALTKEEFVWCVDQIEGGCGGRRLALALSKLRGAFDLADMKRSRRTQVSETWIKKQVQRQCTESPAEAVRVYARWPAMWQAPVRPAPAPIVVRASQPEPTPAAWVQPDTTTPVPAEAKVKPEPFASVKDVRPALSPSNQEVGLQGGGA